MFVIPAVQNYLFALLSVLSQTMRDFELLVLDDGSTDASADIAESLADPRVRVLRLPARGLVVTLNEGAALCRAPLIGRMDADDLCRPRRLELQASFFDRNPDVDVLGGQVHLFGDHRLRQHRYPTSHSAIQAAAVFDSPLVHPTVMFRSSLLVAGLPLYDSNQRHAEDYELWTRWLLAGVRFAALPQVLLDYRVHAGQVSESHRQQQSQVADGVRNIWLEHLGLQASAQELLLHRDIGQGRWGLGMDALLGLELWLLKLLEASRLTGFLEPAAFESVVAQRWTSALWANRGLGRPLRRLVSQSPLSVLRHPQPWKPWLAWLASAAPFSSVVKT